MKCRLGLRRKDHDEEVACYPIDLWHGLSIRATKVERAMLPAQRSNSNFCPFAGSRPSSPLEPPQWVAGLIGSLRVRRHPDLVQSSVADFAAMASGVLANQFVRISTYRHEGLTRVPL